MNSLIASGEGLLLAGLFLAGRRRVLQWIRSIAKRPFLVYGAAYALAFIFAFSYIGNFGILARQRTQMIPLALLMVAMPATTKEGRFRKSSKPSQLNDTDDERLIETQPAVISSISKPGQPRFGQRP